METTTAIVLAGLGVAFYMAWNLGANDAANPTNMAVGSGVLSIRTAAIIFSTFAAIGAILEGYRVSKTIGKGVVPEIDPLMALSAGLGAALWVTLATKKGLPVSTTQSAVGAVLGIGIAKNFSGANVPINWRVVYHVILSWITSPLGAIMLAGGLYIVFRFVAEVLRKKGGNSLVNNVFKYILLGGLLFSAYAYGANDVGNATGVYINAVASITGYPDMKTMRLLALLGSAGIALGAVTWGYRVINTVGFKVTKMDIIAGAAAELSNASIVYLFTRLGMPISTTHASVSSVIGVGLARRGKLSDVNWRTVLIIIVGWVATLPVAAGIAAGIYIALAHFI